MTDGFLAVLWAIVALCVVVLIWNISAVSIIKDCRTIGQFRVEDSVFVCKEKANEILF